ncbi:aldehyde dehydrogenase family protein [Azospirillum sp. CT11-132]|uniref:aldehyde dehydrogenase family protein n=1 Tax=Azospirillum sp. CT11-132 TaxID=3396317 RepID=UPI0039A75DD3
MNFDGDFVMSIGGRPVATSTTLPVVNPATGKVFAAAPDCTPELLDRAVAAARAAFPAWRDLGPDRRSALLKQAGDLMAANAEPLKALLTREQGKPLDDAAGEVAGAAYWLKSFARMDIPVTVGQSGPGRRTETHQMPLGVVGAIAPWNFPLLLAFWKIAPALKAGNTVVVKPSPFTPLATLKAVELLQSVLPAGVLNAVGGGDDLGPWLTAHPGIDKVSFTGSTATGRRVMASAAEGLKRITLELGGNDAAIVLPDIDVDAMAPRIFWSAFRNSGQICVATKRLYIHADIYDRLAAALVAYAASLPMGDGAMPDTKLGPVQNARQFERVKDIIEDCRAQGHRFLCGGDIDGGRDGYFIPVTLVDDPPETSRVVREEAFGPVLPLLKFHDIDGAVARANDCEYGLGGSVWSGDPARAQAIAERLETGTVWINDVQILAPTVAFAGHKQSGFGVENGLDGLLEYCIPRTIVMPAIVMSTETEH